MKRDYEKLYVNTLLRKDNLNKVIGLLEKTIKTKKDGCMEIPDSRLIELLQKAKAEPRPFRKYLICSDTTESTLNRCLEIVSTLKDMSWFKTEYFRQICMKYSGEVGVVYMNGGKSFHFLYSITSKRIQMLFMNGVAKNNSWNGGNNIISGITIDPFDINEDTVDIFRLLYSSEFIGNYRAAKDFNEEFRTDLLRRCVEVLQKKFKDRQINEFSDDFCEFLEKSVMNCKFYDNEIHFDTTSEEDIKRYGDISEVFIQLEAKQSYLSVHSIMFFIFLKLSKTRVEKFESIISCGKKIPTEFIDSTTRKRNQGIIRVDRLYDVEIDIDCPFGVRGHWRNQYRGRDKDGNPIHKMIFIEAYEKKGYHRKATKDLVEGV